jgi:hypothetical protein
VSGWLKALIGTAVAIPLGIVAFIWWVESAFTSGGCRNVGVGRGALVGDSSYQTLRLRCSGRPDEFTVAIGPAGAEPTAAISALGSSKPVLNRVDGRTALFVVGSVGVRVELDEQGRPKTRTDLKDGKVVATLTHRH